MAFLKKCHENGWIEEAYKPMPWWPKCGTSLSEHEMSGSYKAIEHKTVFFKLPIVENNKKILVWSTTPWTLAANVALAINPSIDYCDVEIGSDSPNIIIAKEALGVLEEDKKSIVRIFKGSELVGLHYETCFPDLEKQVNIEHRIVPWDIVDLKEGTGVVHIAPGCGNEDFELGREQGLPSIMPVDDMGRFVEGFDWLSGKSADDVTDIVLEKLNEQNKVSRVLEVGDVWLDAGIDTCTTLEYF